MKKLQKKTLTIYLTRVRTPVGITLKEFNNLYAKLTAKYGEEKHLRLIHKNSYYSNSGFWLVERRMETNAELAKRQEIVNKRLLKQKMEIEKRKAARKIEAARERASIKRQNDSMKKVKMERKVEEVKTMVEVLRAAGFQVSKSTVKKVARN